MFVDFQSDGSVQSGTFELDSTVVDATRGTANTGNLVDISSFTTVLDGLFTVNKAITVPEFGSCVIIVATLSAIAVYRRRQVCHGDAGVRCTGDG